MTTKMLFVLPSSAIGGVQSIVGSIARNLPPQEYEIHIAAPRDGAMFEEYESLGANMHEIPKWTVTRMDPAPILFMRRLVRSEEFDLIHAHNARAGLWASFATLGTETRCVYTGHGWRFIQLKNSFASRVFLAAERLVTARATVVTFVTPHYERNVAVEHKLLPLEKTRTIPNRIDIEALKGARRSRKELRLSFGIPSRGIAVGTVGRLAHEKAPDIFLRTAALLSELDAQFLWVGDGELRQEVLQVAASLGLSERLTITGNRPSDEVPGLLGIMDVFLLTSRYEVLPLTLLEAMGAGTPIVASAVGGVPDVVIPGSTGWLFEPGNPREAAQRVRAVLANGGKTSEIKEKAFSLVSAEYSSTREMALQYHRLYQEVVASDAHGTPAV